MDLDVLRWMGRNLSMPKKFVEEIAIRIGIQSKKGWTAFRGGCD